MSTLPRRILQRRDAVCALAYKLHQHLQNYIHRTETLVVNERQPYSTVPLLGVNWANPGHLVLYEVQVPVDCQSPPGRRHFPCDHLQGGPDLRVHFFRDHSARRMLPSRGPLQGDRDRRSWHVPSLGCRHPLLSSAATSSCCPLAFPTCAERVVLAGLRAVDL